MKEMPASVINLLNTAVDGKIEDFDVDIDEGKLKGENFLGDIVFVSLKNKKTKEDCHLVMKQTLGNKNNLSFLDNVYHAEINFYEHIWPTLNKFQEQLGFNKIAKYYASSRIRGKEILALENLAKQNFRLLDKTKSLDLEHIEFIFKSYGVFHAISYALKLLQPEEFSKLQNYTNKQGFSPADDASASERDSFNAFFTNGLDHAISLFDEETEKDIKDAFREYVKEEPTKVMRRLFCYTGDNPILIHGDCWSNNMMFKYDENGKLEDMRFLDFQMVSCGTPVNDLSYCLYSGASKDILDKLDDLLKMYIASFQDTLQKLNCESQEAYTFEKLKNEWKQFCKFGLMLAIPVWEIKLVDKNHIPNFSEQIPGSVKIAAEHLEVYTQRVRDLVIHLYENGFLQ